MPGQRGAVADALDLEALLEAVGDAFDHVRDQRARQAVQRAILAALGRARDRDHALVLRDLHALRHLLAELALRAGDRDAAGIDRDEHAGGHFDGFLTDTGHGFSAAPGYQTKQMTSPPMPCCSAVRLVTTPLEVDMIAMPMPPSTRWRRSLPA